MARVIAMLAAVLLAVAAPTMAEPSPPKPLFASDNVLEFTLTASLDALLRDRQDTETAVPATLALAGEAPETLAVAVSLRGNSRRKRHVCTFPPLRLTFAKGLPELSLFRGQKKLKLVTHCRSSERFQQHVLLEYAAYRLLNQLTPESFRVRLVRIRYQEPGDDKPLVRYGFLIEDVDDMAKRNGKRERNGQKPVAPGQLTASGAARTALFQEMIGNLDWSMTVGTQGDQCCHNSRLIGAKDAETDLVPVPYDFDYSGLVNAPYAIPPEGIKVTSVRTRRYRGLCAHNDAVPAAAAAMQAQRSALLGVFDTVSSLDARTRQRSVDYVADYIDNRLQPDKVSSRIANQCRK